MRAVELLAGYQGPKLAEIEAKQGTENRSDTESQARDESLIFGEIVRGA